MSNKKNPYRIPKQFHVIRDLLNRLCTDAVPEKVAGTFVFVDGVVVVETRRRKLYMLQDCGLGRDVSGVLADGRFNIYIHQLLKALAKLYPRCAGSIAEFEVWIQHTEDKYQARKALATLKADAATHGLYLTRKNGSRVC